MAGITTFIESLGPDIVYALLLLGLWLVITAVYLPGMGLPEGGALLSLALAGAGLWVLSARWLGIILLVIGSCALLALLLFRDVRWLPLVGIALFLVGGFFLFPRGERVSALGLLIVNVLGAAYHQIILLPGLAVQGRAGPLDADALVGREARVVEAIIAEDGMVVVNGERWHATADAMIDSGEYVRVTAQQGMTLHVKPLQPSGQ